MSNSCNMLSHSTVLNPPYSNIRSYGTKCPIWMGFTSCKTSSGYRTVTMALYASSDILELFGRMMPHRWEPSSPAAANVVVHSGMPNFSCAVAISRTATTAAMSLTTAGFLLLVNFLFSRRAAPDATPPNSGAKLCLMATRCNYSTQDAVLICKSLLSNVVFFFGSFCVGFGWRCFWFVCLFCGWVSFVLLPFLWCALLHFDSHGLCTGPTVFFCSLPKRRQCIILTINFLQVTTCGTTWRKLRRRWTEKKTTTAAISLLS